VPTHRLAVITHTDPPTNSDHKPNYQAGFRKTGYEQAFSSQLSFTARGLLVVIITIMLATEDLTSLSIHCQFDSLTSHWMYI